MKTFEAKRIAVFGDWHGNLEFAVRALDYVYTTEHVDLYFHVGDFGFWPADNEESWLPMYLPGLERLLEAQAKTFIFVDGNHEHFTWLETFPLDEHGLRKISDHIYHLPRGTAILVGGKKIVGLGGARSTDRKFRIKDYSWFENEVITRADLEKALNNKTADILITHEAPELQSHTGTGSFELDRATAEQRSYIAEAAVRLEAKLLIHGHHHRAYQDMYRGTQVIGLGCDSTIVTQNAIDHNYITIELKEI